MKQKLLTLLICVALIVSLSACSVNETTDNNTSKNNVETSGYEETTPAPKKELTEREKMILKVSELMDKDLAFDVGSYIMGDIKECIYQISSKYYCEEDAAGNIIDNGFNHLGMFMFMDLGMSKLVEC